MSQFSNIPLTTLRQQIAVISRDLVGRVDRVIGVCPNFSAQTAMSIEGLRALNATLRACRNARNDDEAATLWNGFAHISPCCPWHVCWVAVGDPSNGFEDSPCPLSLQRSQPMTRELAGLISTEISIEIKKRQKAYRNM